MIIDTQYSPLEPLGMDYHSHVLDKIFVLAKVGLLAHLRRDRRLFLTTIFRAGSFQFSHQGCHGNEAAEINA